MKSTTGLKVLGIAMLILLGCVSASAQDVKYNFMPGTDFTKYKSYRWARVPNVQYPDQIIDNQITQAIDAQLGLKGLTKSGGETADLVLTYQAAVSQEKQWNSFSTGNRHRTVNSLAAITSLPWCSCLSSAKASWASERRFSNSSASIMSWGRSQRETGP